MEIGEAVGQRVRALRIEAGVTQDQLARACRRYGVEEYSASRIGQIESGAMAPTVTALVGLALGIGEVTGRRLTIADLIPDADSVQAGRRLAFTGEELRGFLSGTPVTPPPAPRYVGTVPDPTLTPGWGTTDDLAVATWDVPPVLVRSVAESLWGTGETLTKERDRRAGPDATPQKRGRISRDVIAEAKSEFDRLAAAGQL